MRGVILLALVLAGCGSGQADRGLRNPDTAAQVANQAFASGHSAAPVHDLPAQLTPAPGVPGDPNAGRTLFVARGCEGCHTLSGVPEATGVAGPRLDNVAVRGTIAGDQIPGTPENLARWIFDPASLKPSTTMPRPGVTPEEARDLAAFLYSLPQNP
ncbi:MAG TPA: c-type cytochrome [Chloroflexota bacterium]